MFFKKYLQISLYIPYAQRNDGLKSYLYKKKCSPRLSYVRDDGAGWRLEAQSGSKIRGVGNSQQVPLSPHIPTVATVSGPGHPLVGSPTESGSHVAQSRDTWPSDFADLRGDRNVARWEGALGSCPRKNRALTQERGALTSGPSTPSTFVSHAPPSPTFWLVARPIASDNKRLTASRQRKE